MQQTLMSMSSFTCSLVGALGQNLRSPKAWGTSPRSHLLFPVKAVKFFTDRNIKLSYEIMVPNVLFFF